MARFMFLHCGFENPTDELMQAWRAWFNSIAERQLDQGGFVRGREISKSGVRDLSWDASAITGYNVIEAENLEAAMKFAESNPFVAAIRVYELR